MKKLTPEEALIAKRAAQLGFALAIICHLLPHDYRVACEVLSKFCAGGL